MRPKASASSAVDLASMSRGVNSTPSLASSSTSRSFQRSELPGGSFKRGFTCTAAPPWFDARVACRGGLLPTPLLLPTLLLPLLLPTLRLLLLLRRLLPLQPLLLLPL